MMYQSDQGNIVKVCSRYKMPRRGHENGLVKKE